ncbi:sucrose-6-phosphate hydrolase [Clostridium disporicum]|uniref:Sucrose-6-phosphate hydrolase n=3 Tax=Clostridiaceae TaxID=31979 RepID=A0A174BAD4_9CLOT|nr:sucrose-6-phosphate hydrolase [Clostridium disporicum]CUP14233.1 sucrose-6-phosphate hydrolase [Clostridium disporicum]SCK00051.1 Sucrose-6-phosphate hydrolase [uncultured Clostridium sp.]
MMIENNFILEKVRKYEKEFINCISKEEKPSFHLCAPIGWINDPNGFSTFNNEYHLFYQYHPYDVVWGPMYWGHSKTNDFIKWEQLPIALAPEASYDMGGCFSGSALEYDGKHVIMYTGVLDNKDENGERVVRQTQCIAIGDGENYEKLECNPVITHEMLPEGSSLEDFRDPKIWREGEEFYCVVASRSNDGSGQILMYKSNNLKEWEFVTIVDNSKNKVGRMWECPDLFSLNGKGVLIISPQEVKATKDGFHNGSNTAYLIEKYDNEKKSFERESCNVIDFGLDFYAPQTLESIDGRRIMIGWMHSWENRIVPGNFKWCGMMTMPRELTIRDGCLIQNPIREIENYYKNTVEYNNLIIKDEVSLDGIFGRELDITIDIDGSQAEEFKIKLAKNNEYETIISFNSKKNIIEFDRSYSGNYGDILHKREMKVRDKNGKVKMRLIIDKYSVEIFANDGEQVMTSTFYTPLEATGITFASEGNSIINIKKHDIEV